MKTSSTMVFLGTTALTGALNRRRLLILSMIGFGLANVFAFVARDYWALIAARVLLAVAAGQEGLDHLQIPVAELVPQERVDSLRGLIEPALVVQRLGKQGYHGRGKSPLAHGTQGLIPSPQIAFSCDRVTYGQSHQGGRDGAFG